MNNSEPLTLYSLNNLVRNVIAQELPMRYWVTGELSEVRETAAGHCYIELVQRDEVTGELVAKARGTIWQRVYSLLSPYFYEETGRAFSSGVNVLLQVKVTFHELYGYTLEVCDIEPSYTVGETARRRRLVINRLEKEGGGRRSAIRRHLRDLSEYFACYYARISPRRWTSSCG